MICCCICCFSFAHCWVILILYGLLRISGGFCSLGSGSYWGLAFEGMEYVGWWKLDNLRALTCDPKAGRVLVAVFPSQHGCVCCRDVRQPGIVGSWSRGTFICWKMGGILITFCIFISFSVPMPEQFNFLFCVPSVQHRMIFPLVLDCKCLAVATNVLFL